MKIIDKDGNEVAKGTLKLVEPDGTEKEFDPVKWVKQARSSSSEAQANRLKLKDVEARLEKYKGADGEYVDPELAIAAIARGDKVLKDKNGLEEQLKAANEKWQEKLDAETGELINKLTALKNAQNEAALLGCKDLQGTIFAKMGAKHLLTEFGSFLNEDGHPVDRSGKPIMADDDPTKPATVAEAAKVWIATHPDGKDKIMADTFSGGSGGLGGPGGLGDTGQTGYAGIVAGAQK